MPSISTAAPSPLPVPSPGQPRTAATPPWTADWWSLFQQMQLTLSAMEARLAALERGEVISVANLASTPVAPPVAPPASSASKPPTAATSRRRVQRSTPNTPLPAPHARELNPMGGNAARFECVLELPDALVPHVVGRRGAGLKQAHDISGSRLTAFSMDVSGSVGERRFVTIRGADQQIGEALVVIGKRIAKQRVRAPRKQRGKNAVPEAATPAPSRDPAPSTPSHTAQERLAPPSMPRTSATPTPIGSGRSSPSTPRPAPPISTPAPPTPMQVASTSHHIRSDNRGEPALARRSRPFRRK